MPCPHKSHIYNGVPSIHMYTISKFHQNGKHPYTRSYDIYELLPGFDASNQSVWHIYSGEVSKPIICPDKYQLVDRMNGLLESL